MHNRTRSHTRARFEVKIETLKLKMQDSENNFTSGNFEDALPGYERIIAAIEVIEAKTLDHLRYLTSAHSRISQIYARSDYRPDEILDKLLLALVSAIELGDKANDEDYLLRAKIQRRLAVLHVSLLQPHQARGHFISSIVSLSKIQHPDENVWAAAAKNYSEWHALYLTNTGYHFTNFAQCCFEVNDEAATGDYLLQIYHDLILYRDTPTTRTFFQPMTQLMQFLLDLHLKQKLPNNKIAEYLSKADNRSIFREALRTLESLYTPSLKSLCEDHPSTQIAIVRELRDVKAQLAEAKLNNPQAFVTAKQGLFAQDTSSKRARDEAKPDELPPKKRARSHSR